MTYQDLFEFIIKQKSYLCVGLDTDASKIPPYLLEKEDAQSIQYFSIPNTNWVGFLIRF